jgi:galactokinase
VPSGYQLRSVLSLSRAVVYVADIQPELGKSDDQTLRKLGELMNESMMSCAQLFECSHPRLDALTALARSAGAYGARLTGAGWGGCAVALVAEDEVDAFIQKIKAGYEEYQGLDGEKLKEVVFATKPSSGACGECLHEHTKTRMLTGNSSIQVHGVDGNMYTK